MRFQVKNKREVLKKWKQFKDDLERVISIRAIFGYADARKSKQTKT